MRFKAIIILIVSFAISFSNAHAKENIFGNGELSRITVSPNVCTITINETIKFKASPLDSNGQIIYGIPIDWSINDSSIGSISFDGVFVPKKEGHCFITASNGSINGQAEVTVCQPQKITIEPKKVNLNIKSKFQFKAIVKSDKDEIINPKILFTVDNDNLGSINEDGLLTVGNNEGLLRVKASVGNLSDESVVNIIDPTIVYDIVIEPESPEVLENSQIQLKATLKNFKGDILVKKPLWEVDNRSLAVIDPNGLLSAKQPGVVNVSCSSDKVKKVFPVNIKPVVISRVEVPVKKYQIKVFEKIEITAFPVGLNDEPLSIKIDFSIQKSPNNSAGKFVIASINEFKASFVSNIEGDYILKASSRNIYTFIEIKVVHSVEVAIECPYILNIGWVFSDSSYQIPIRNKGTTAQKFSIKIREGKYLSSNNTLIINHGQSYNITITPSKPPTPNSVLFDVLSISWMKETKKIVIIGYCKPPAPVKPRPKYTGWTGICANATKCSSVPITDAPGAINPALIWSEVQFNLKTSSYEPVVWNDKVYKTQINDDFQGIRCYKLSTGSLLWESEDLTDSEAISNPSVYKDKILTVCGNELVCLDADNGQILWNWSQYLEEVGSRPVMGVDCVFSGGSHIRCHNIETGEIIWQAGYYGNYYIDLGLNSGKLQFYKRDLSNLETAELFIVDGKTGKTLLNKVIPNPSLMTVFGQDRLFIRYDDNLTCRSSINGNILWEYETMGDNISVPAVYDIYTILLDESNIICLDARNGRKIWSRSISSGFNSVPKIAGNRIYALSEYDGMYCYDLKTGNLLTEPMLDDPNDLSKWVSIIIAEGTLVIVYDTYSGGTNMCLYANNDRFKGISQSCFAQIITPNSSVMIHNKYGESSKNINMPSPAKMVNGILYAPIAPIMTNLGGQYSYSQKDKKIICMLRGNTLEMYLNQLTGKINGKLFRFDQKSIHKPQLFSNQILCPLQICVDKLGIKCAIIPENNSVVLTYHFEF